MPVRTIGGKPQGFSDDDAADLRKEVEAALASGAHILLLVAAPKGPGTSCKTCTYHAQASGVPRAEFHAAVYQVAHDMLTCRFDSGDG